MDKQQPAPTRASKRLKLVRAAQEKLQPKSNEALAALPKASFISSVVSALPSRDETLFALGEGTRRDGPVTKEVREMRTRRRKDERARWEEEEEEDCNSFLSIINLVSSSSSKKTARRRRTPPPPVHGDQRRRCGTSQGTR